MHRRGLRRLEHADHRRACAAAPGARAAAALSHPRTGRPPPSSPPTPAPCQAWPAKFEVTDPNEDAAELNSAASPSQAAAAASIGAEPAPENISAELISGGSIKKLMAVDLRRVLTAPPRLVVINNVARSHETTTTPR